MRAFVVEINVRATGHVEQMVIIAPTLDFADLAIEMFKEQRLEAVAIHHVRDYEVLHIIVVN